MYLPESYWWWCFASAACGIQNATFTKFTGNFIRTTHMTGVLNDIAFMIGRMAFGKRLVDTWRLKVLIPSVGGFFAGGLMSVHLYRYMGRACMFLCAGFVLLLGIAYTSYVNRLDVPFPPSPHMGDARRNIPKDTTT